MALKTLPPLNVDGPSVAPSWTGTLRQALWISIRDFSSSLIKSSLSRSSALRFHNLNYRVTLFCFNFAQRRVVDCWWSLAGRISSRDAMLRNNKLPSGPATRSSVVRSAYKTAIRIYQGTGRNGRTLHCGRAVGRWQPSLLFCRSNVNNQFLYWEEDFNAVT